jgi:hypothetical protein
MARPFLVPFRRLLRLVGSRWRYSTPPPHGLRSEVTAVQIITRNTLSQQNVFHMLWNDSPQFVSLKLKDCSIAANNTAIIPLFVQLHHV